MKLQDLQNQIKDLDTILLDLVDTCPGKVMEAIELLKGISPTINEGMNISKSKRLLVENNLIDKYIKTLNNFDVHEALNITIKEADEKFKSFDFTREEKNKIINTFKGGIPSFLEKFNGEVRN